MSDVSAVAAAHDIVQILFYFVCSLAMAIAGCGIWFARSVLIPFRDNHFDFLKHQVEFMTIVIKMLDNMEDKGEERLTMHRDNQNELQQLHAENQRMMQSLLEIAEEIKSKIRCPVT